MIFELCVLPVGDDVMCTAAVAVAWKKTSWFAFKTMCWSVSVAVNWARAALRVATCLSPIPALFYRGFLVGAGRGAEGFVAMREAAEAVDDVEMFLRIILEHRVVERSEQP